MVTISYEQMESLLETLEILADREFSNQLKAGIQQDKEEKIIVVIIGAGIRKEGDQLLLL